MSMAYWMIEGIGIDTYKIESYLDKKKLANVLARQLPDDELINEIVRLEKYNELDIDDFLCGEPFNNLADILTYCDDTNTLTYGDDGEGGAYFYYPPSMPWHRVQNEPDSIEEVHRRIIDAVKELTILSDEQIEKMIDDDLYVMGCG